MATSLSRTTSFMRKFLLITVIGTVILTVLQIFTGLLFEPEKDPNYTPPDQNKNLFLDGCALPYINFDKIPQAQLKSKVLTSGTKALFKTDIIEKDFPLFPSTLNVYKILAPIERITDTDRAKQNATVLGFLPNAYTTDPNNSNSLIWKNRDGSKIFIYDKGKKDWELIVDYSKLPLKIINENLNSFDTFSRTFLSRFTLSNDSFYNGLFQFELIINKFDGSEELVNDVKIANKVRLSVTKKIDQMKCRINNSEVMLISEIYSPDYLDPSLQIDFTGMGENTTTDIASLSIREFSFDSVDVGVYPAITIAEAIKRLENNKGTLYWIKPEDRNKYGFIPELSIKEFFISVENTKIVYIEPFSYIEDDPSTHYLQPYFQISGYAIQNNEQYADFIFLIPALRDEHYL